MACPLSPAPNTTLNFSTPPTSRRFEKYEVHTYTSHSKRAAVDLENEEGDSSPFINSLKEDSEVNTSASPSKSRPASRIMSGAELSPLKILQERSSDHEPAPSSDGQPMPPPQRSPRKMSSPEKRFPVKISSSDETPRAKPRDERQISLEEAMRQNEGLQHAIDIFEDEVSVLENGNKGEGHGDAEDDDSHTARVEVEHIDQDDEPAGVDDTMISTFSTFSAVPNMTMFAKLGHSPGKFATDGGVTPRAARGEPSPSRTPRTGPFPDRNAHYESGNTTNLLMDFTEQLRHPHQQHSPSHRGRLSPSKTTPNVAGNNTINATPQRHNIVNLLDFDLPPIPTPRSIPTITPRELESLKSNFLSEISSLKASLSGKEAEVLSLKTAVTDAEKRVGECMEQLREERGLREQLADERESWEKRGRDMENVLRKVKEEIVLGQREREELESKLDEADKRREAAEMMAQEAESKMAGMRAGQAAAAASSPDKTKSPTAGGQQREVEIAVERVARELHGAYKAKHETKVAALKKSYEARWEKKVRELEAKIEDLADENDRMRVGRDATMTRVVPADAEVEKERKAQAAKDAAQIKQLGAEVVKLEAVVKTVQADNNKIRTELERERVEKGELVMLAEEMMSMQSFVAPDEKRIVSSAVAVAAAAAGGAEKRQPVTESARGGAVARPSGLKAPGQSRIGRPGHERGQSGGGGIPRPGSGLAMRSGIMSSIERMGSYRGRGE